MLFEIHLNGLIQSTAGTLDAAANMAMELIGLGKVEIVIVNVK